MGVPRKAFQHALKALYDWIDTNLGALSTFGLIPAETDIVLVANGGQGNATVLRAVLNEVKDVNSGGDDAAELPHAMPGMQVRVTNNHADNAFNLYNKEGDILNPLTGNPSDAPYFIGPNSTYMFFCMTEGEWNNI